MKLKILERKERHMARRFYSEGRLYSANARLISLDLADLLDKWVDEGLLADFEHCFLPYRDDDGEITSEEQYFNTDKEAIDNSIAVAGYLEGATYDSGCGWEIGYAYSKGYPIHLITTDFLLWYSGYSKEYYPVSKLIHHIAKVVAPYEEDYSIEVYRERLEDLRDRAFAELRANLIEDFGVVKEPNPPLEALPIEYDYYLDPNFNYTEPSRNLLRDIQEAIKFAGKTYIVGNNMDDIESDIVNLRKSGRAIFYSDVFEPNIDSGVMHGIAYGIGRPPIVYCSKQQRFHSGIADDYLNGMVRYSTEAVVRSLTELIAYINTP